jgi:hypothetical protein
MQVCQTLGGILGAWTAINYIPKPWLRCVCSFRKSERRERRELGVMLLPGAWLRKNTAPAALSTLVRGGTKTR